MAPNRGYTAKLLRSPERPPLVQPAACCSAEYANAIREVMNCPFLQLGFPCVHPNQTHEMISEAFRQPDVFDPLKLQPANRTVALAVMAAVRCNGSGGWWMKFECSWHTWHLLAGLKPEYELIKVQILANENLRRRDNVLPVLLNEEARQLAMNNPMLSFKPQPFWLEAIDPLPIIQLRPAYAAVEKPTIPPEVFDKKQASSTLSKVPNEILEEFAQFYLSKRSRSDVSSSQEKETHSANAAGIFTPKNDSRLALVLRKNTVIQITAIRTTIARKFETEARETGLGYGTKDASPYFERALLYLPRISSNLTNKGDERDRCKLEEQGRLKERSSPEEGDGAVVDCFVYRIYGMGGGPNAYNLAEVSPCGDQPMNPSPTARPEATALHELVARPASAVKRASQIEKGARQHGKSVRLSSKPSFVASNASGIPADRDATAETSSYVCLLLRLAPELAPMNFMFQRIGEGAWQMMRERAKRLPVYGSIEERRDGGIESRGSVDQLSFFLFRSRIQAFKKEK
ncbi:hypothetical protein Acr_00g0003400 [Actinidia rufa]|uniref:Uncharacterized protein n=1 Tax=Actinidia rufa TaxID=165716 RepID=A0A7J0D743_9ERIC|nr:hypothetical protein Acr_00g0003400 [Actinidia rufa]